MRDRAELIATKVGTLRSWLSGDRPAPQYPFLILKAFEIMTAEQQKQLQRFARESAQRGDYAPVD